jgi:hypothetical protein
MTPPLSPKVSPGLRSKTVQFYKRRKLKMDEPGKTVRDEKEYKKEPQKKRDYWEKGENDSLTDELKEKLCKKADDAAKYDPKTKESGEDYPRTKDKKIDHGALVHNAKRWVYDALQPHRDIPGISVGGRSLGEIVGSCSSPQKPVDPSNGDSKLPAWVCVNCAKLLAGILRCLGYPVREVNTWLSQGNFLTRTYPYQEGAIQVWFEGKWHYADAYLCIYDPEKTLSGYTDYNDVNPHYWDGTEPPTDWRAGTRADKNWKELKDPGTDLQKRFFSLKSDEHGLWFKPREGDSWRTASLLHHTGDSSRSGIFIRTFDEGATLYLTDSEGRITDGVRNEIPGAFRMPAGTPITYAEMLDPGRPVDGPAVQPEWVFFGTRLQIAEFEEIGEHELTLMVLSQSHSVRLEVEVISSDHRVSIAGLPDHVDVADGVGSVPFNVTIDPIDPGFHVSFNILLHLGLVRPEHYQPQTEFIRAAQLRATGEQEVKGKDQVEDE